MTMGGSNFAAFCGTQDQRRQTLLQAVSRYCGRCGIVVLHDDPQLETMLSALPQQLAAAGGAPQNFQVHTLQRKNYDPLSVWTKMRWSICCCPVMKIPIPLPSCSRCGPD